MDDKSRRPDSASSPDQINNETDNALNFGVLPELIGYHLRRAQVHLFADFARTMAEAQMTPGQFGVISLIGANPGLSQSALARAVGIERSTMVAVIDALQGRGLVERRPSPVDRRSYALILTQKGAELLDRSTPLVRAHERNVARRLSAADKDKLIELLTKLIA
jgi:DNA-binding MarR family transcriptional regulator